MSLSQGEGILNFLRLKRNKMFTKNQEQLLISSILKGDEKSLYSYYRYFSPKLLAFIKKKTGKIEDAEEILQDTLLSSLDSLRDFTFKSSLSTFLHAIAKHKIIDFYRKRRIKKVLFSQAPQLEALLTTLLGPEEIFENRQKKAIFEKALRELRPIYRKILTLKYLDGKTVRQITSELQISFKSAESMLFRARQAFAKGLNQR